MQGGAAVACVAHNHEVVGAIPAPAPRKNGTKDMNDNFSLIEPNWAGEYILDENKNPIPITDIKKWADWFMHETNRLVAHTELRKNLWIQTIFLGHDEDFPLSEGEPFLFETGVLINFRSKNGKRVEYKQYKTWSEAEEGHKRMVEKWSNIITGHTFIEWKHDPKLIN
jgi:hypothetical protein